MPSLTLPFANAAFGLSSAVWQQPLHTSIKQHFHHNDIKPRNVLVKDWCVYLTDFGASSWIPGEESTTVKGADYTTKYCAPEQFGTGVRRYLPG